MSRVNLRHDVRHIFIILTPTIPHFTYTQTLTMKLSNKKRNVKNVHEHSRDRIKLDFRFLKLKNQFVKII